MKRNHILISLICLLALAFSLSACSSADEAGGDSSSPSSSVSQGAGTSAPSSDAQSGSDTAAASSAPATSAGASSAPAAAEASRTTAASPNPSSAAAPASTAAPAAETSAAAPSSQAAPSSVPAVNRITVTLSVDCRTGVEQGYQAAIDTAEDGEILSATTVVAQEGTTAYDLLLRSGLEVEAEDSITGKYVRSIQELGVGDCGNASGWLYSVNGEFPGKSCGKYVLSDGDVVCWRYTCQNGADMYE